LKGFVLDSYALMAFFEDEPGAVKVEQLLTQAENNNAALVMSVVNWGEVYYSLYRSKGQEQAEEAILIIEQLPIKLVDVDKNLMYLAAKLKANHAIALGDCIAAALAINTNYAVVTGDKEFKQLGKQVKLEWLQ